MMLLVTDRFVFCVIYSLITLCLFVFNPPPPAEPDPVPEASPAAERSSTTIVHGGPGHQLVFPQNEGGTRTD